MGGVTDDQLIEFLGLGRCSGEVRTKVLRSITPARRAVYDRMAEVEVALQLWECGLGPKPSGVLIDGVRAVRRGRRQRNRMHRG